MMWVCTGCGAEFEPSPYRIKQRFHRCQSCVSKQNVAYAKQLRLSGTPRKVTEAKKASDERRRENPDSKRKDAERARKRRNDPAQRQKIKARALVGQHIRSGKLNKQPCEICGSDDSQAHHFDYAKPLDVRWFCRDHHSEHHAAEKLAEDLASNAGH